MEIQRYNDESDREECIYIINNRNYKKIMINYWQRMTMINHFINHKVKYWP